MLHSTVLKRKNTLIPYRTNCDDKKNRIASLGISILDIFIFLKKKNHRVFRINPSGSVSQLQYLEKLKKGGM